MVQYLMFLLGSFCLFGSQVYAQIGKSGFDFVSVESRASHGLVRSINGDYWSGSTLGGGVDGAGFDFASRRLLNNDGTPQGTGMGFDISQFMSRNPFSDSDTVELSAHSSAYAESNGADAPGLVSLADITFGFQYEQPFIVRGTGMLRSTRTDLDAGAIGNYFGSIVVSNGFGSGATIVRESIGGVEPGENSFVFEVLVEPDSFFGRFEAEIHLSSFASSSLQKAGAGFGVEAELNLEFFPVPAPSSIVMLSGLGFFMRRQR